MAVSPTIRVVAPRSSSTAHGREAERPLETICPDRRGWFSLAETDFQVLADEGTAAMPSCVLAYSGGLDTSVILGWLLDEGYDVHCLYVDLGQPCEDRQAILEKASKTGAASARLVDVRDELCRDFAFPGAGVAGQVRSRSICWARRSPGR